MNTRDQMLELHHAGKSREQIAAALNLSVDQVWRLQVRARIARPAHQTKATMTGDNMVDPRRADRRLRRFSWQDA